MRIKMFKKIKMIFHKHSYKLKFTSEDIWAECSCGKQLDIPDERLYLAYQKLREHDFFWEI